MGFDFWWSQTLTISSYFLPMRISGRLGHHFCVWIPLLHPTQIMNQLGCKRSLQKLFSELEIAKWFTCIIRAARMGSSNSFQTQSLAFSSREKYSGLCWFWSFLEQWFSTRLILLPWGIWQCLMTFFVTMGEGTSILLAPSRQRPGMLLSSSQSHPLNEDFSSPKSQ